MKFFLLAFVILLSANVAQAAKCDIKAVQDKEDGAIYYDKDHRLHKFVKLQKDDKTFCSESQAKRAGYAEAPENFSNSTARLVECIEDGVKSCLGYVVGQYRSLAIYDKACAGDASQTQIVHSFLDHAKNSGSRMDTEKFYGTTGALMDAFPCNGSRHIAKK